MSTLHTIQTQVDDEQLNCEHLVELWLEEETSDEQDGGLPVLVDLKVLETRELDDHGKIVRRILDGAQLPHVAELLEDPSQLRNALDNATHSTATDRSAVRRSGSSGLRDVVADRRNVARCPPGSSDRDAG